MRSFEAAPLAAAKIDPAFALIRAWHPSVELDAWRGFARLLLDGGAAPGNGITGIRNEAGYLCGLFVHRVEPDLHHRRALVIDPVAALDVIDVKAVVRAMVEAADAMAHGLGCSVVRFRIPAQQAWLTNHLQTAGHHVEANVLTTPVVFAAPPT